MPAGYSSARRVIDGDRRPNRLRDVLAQLHKAHGRPEPPRAANSPAGPVPRRNRNTMTATARDASPIDVGIGSIGSGIRACAPAIRMTTRQPGRNDPTR